MSASRGWRSRHHCPPGTGLHRGTWQIDISEGKGTAIAVQLPLE